MTITRTSFGQTWTSQQVLCLCRGVYWIKLGYAINLVLCILAASEAGYDDVSEADEGLISNGDDVEDLLQRTRNDLGPVIRNTETLQRRPGKF
jgi:hypothetical protein